MSANKVERFGSYAETRTQQDAEAVCEAVRMPMELRALALKNWRDIRAGRKPQATYSDADWRAQALARLSETSARMIKDAKEYRDDPQDESESDDELQGFGSCPKCGSEDIGLEYNSKDDSLDCACERCRYEWNCASLTQEEISAARTKAEVRKRMHAARGF